MSADRPGPPAGPRDGGAAVDVADVGVHKSLARADAGSGPVVSEADRARYAAVRAAAADPELLFGSALDAFHLLHAAVRASERAAAALATAEVESLCLALCASRAASARAADDRHRFLQIIIGWAWPRRPALAAALEASCAAEMGRWGGEVAGEA